MGYISNSDIEERMGTAVYTQLTDDTGSGSADLDKVNEARLGAEGEAESYLARRYAVPIDINMRPEVKSILMSVVLDLVEYRLHSRRPPIPQDMVNKRSQAIAWLEKVAGGQVVLPAVAAPADNSAVGVLGQQMSSERVFSREQLDSL